MDLRSLRSRPREKRGRISRHDTDSPSRFYPHLERMRFARGSSHFKWTIRDPGQSARTCTAVGVFVRLPRKVV